MITSFPWWESMADDSKPEESRSQQLADKLLGQVPSYELDITGSSLLASDVEIPEIGQFSALTDAIILLFQDIETRLAKYLTSYDEDEKEELHRDMKRFLGRINANHLIPLKFRLRVLQSFSREAEFLDADLTYAILNAYKVAILHILDAAHEKPVYHLPLAKLCGDAITLAVRVTRLQLRLYREPSIQVTRHVHELTRLGLGALGKIDETSQASKFKESINHNLAWYELLSMANFFALTLEGQDILYDSLEPYISKVVPFYCPRRQSALSTQGHVYLVHEVGTGRPVPEWSDKGVQPIHEWDRVILDISQLVPILRSQLQEAQAHMNDIEKQKRELRTEHELHMTLAVAKHLLTCLLDKPRKEERAPAKGQWTHVIGNMKRALTMPHKPSFRLSPLHLAEEEEQRNTWNLTDMSKTGMSVETDELKYLPDVTNVIRMVWPENDEEAGRPFWAQVMWRRQAAKGGPMRMGLQFLPPQITCWRRQPYGGNVEAGDRGNYFVLGAKLAKRKEFLIWTHDKNIQAGSTFELEMNSQWRPCRVLRIIQVGANHVVCLTNILTQSDQVGLEQWS